LVVIGDRLGLYRAMADSGRLTPEELAERAGTDPRYVREWLSNQAAGGYVSYDAVAKRFWLTPEQSLALAQEGSPAFVPGAFQLATALIKDEPTITQAFKTGSGVGWHGGFHPLSPRDRDAVQPRPRSPSIAAGDRLIGGCGDPIRSYRSDSWRK
jgi:hypothetical protein